MSSKTCHLVGIGGGTGAGKTTVAKALLARLGPSRVAILPQDAYYRDRSHLSPRERAKMNYDHPDAFDNDLLIVHLKTLRAGKSIQRLVYDFVTHTRTPETVRIIPCSLIILEGIIVLADERIRKLLDFKIFVETDPDVRVIRRTERDINERGRSFEEVKQHYPKTVRPMHLTFVEPSKQYADIIIPDGYNEVALGFLIIYFHPVLDNFNRTYL